MKVKKFLCSLVVGTALMTNSVSASGIPVFDGGVMANDITSWLQDTSTELAHFMADNAEQLAQKAEQIATKLQQAEQWVAERKAEIMNYMEELGLVELVGQIQELKSQYDEISGAVMSVHSVAMKDYKNAKNTLEGLMDGDLDPFIKQITGGKNGKVVCEKDSKYNDSKNSAGLVDSSERRYTFCMNRLATQASILNTFDNTQRKINILRDKMREVYEDAATSRGSFMGEQGQVNAKINQRALQIAYLKNEIDSEMKLAEIELVKQQKEFEMAQAKYLAEVKSNNAVRKFIGE